jgi:outer membrane protein OmpA-like peptidoglycan-associated protein
MISINRKISPILFFCLISIYFSYSQQIKDTTLIVYFDNNKYSFTQSENNKLDSFFWDHQFAVIKNISGYTDPVGSSTSNFILAEKRNNTVIDFLKKYSFLKDSYQVNNFGETHPASQSDNALNRRVEITIQFKKDIVADTSNVKKESTIIKKIVLDKLYFKPDLPVLESFSLDYLKRIAAILKTYADAKFEIRGHVNCPLNVPANSGYMQKMNELSEDRARTVFEILQDNGILAEKMTYRGMGNTEMINPYAKTDEEKRQNMRVEIFISSNR